MMRNWLIIALCPIMGINAMENAEFGKEYASSLLSSFNGSVSNLSSNNSNDSNNNDSDWMELLIMQGQLKACIDLGVITEEEEVAQNMKKGFNGIKKSFLKHFKANRKQLLLDFLVKMSQETGLDNNDEEMKEIIKRIKEQAKPTE